jgi:hypothetical protein
MIGNHKSYGVPKDRLAVVISGVVAMECFLKLRSTTLDLILAQTEKLHRAKWASDVQ